MSAVAASFLFLLAGAGSDARAVPRTEIALRRVRPAGSSEAAPPRTQAFPHLITAYGPRTHPSALPQAWTPHRPSLRGNAAFNLGSPLPPSVLGSDRLARAAAMLKAPDPRSFLGAYRAAKAASTPDTMRILVLRVDFLKDTPGSKTTGNGRFDLGREDSTSRSLPIDPAPHDRNYFAAHMEALSRYYRVMSGGSLVLKWDIFPAERDSAYHLPDTRKYGPWIWSNSNPDVFVHIIDFVGDALAAADSSDSSLDFTTMRGDSLVPRYDSYIIFHAGADLQGDINGDSPWDIPSLNLYVQDPFVVQDSTVAVNLVQIVPETATQDGFYGAMNGVLTHEFGHQIGFTDLYDVATGGSVVGAFSLMDSGENLYGYIADPKNPGQTLAVRGTLPGSVDPWHKVLFFPDGVDLVEPEQYLSGDSSRYEVTLPSSQLGNRMLYLPLNLSEYLLVENRVWELNGDSSIVLKADKETGVILGPVPADTLAPASDLGYREYDYLLPGEGVLAWHIDNLAINTGLATPYGGVNIFFSRPGVAVMEGDGIRDIGTASNEYLGGPYDPYYLGGYTCLGPSTVPSSRTNDGTPTGITMCALDSIGVIARVSVDKGLGPAGWPVAISGAPQEEQYAVLPADTPSHQPTLLAAAGTSLYGWRPDAKPVQEGGPSSGVLIDFGTPVDQGIAVHPAFGFLGGDSGDLGRAPAVAVVAGGTLQLLTVGSAGAVSQLTWPAGPPGDSVVTATPALDGDFVWAGCNDGVIRAFSPIPDRNLLLRCAAARGAIRALGVGRMNIEGAEGDDTFFWETDQGESGAASRPHASAGPPARILFREERHLPGVTPAGVLAIPSSAGGPARIMFAWSDGTIEWRALDGSLLPGWPASLGAAPAGSPIVCDADGDGVMETVAADVRGRVHCLATNGMEEFGWPRSIWSEDETEPPAQILGVRALDVDGNGGPEILIQRADGFLVALDGSGKAVPGWPRALGANARVGPEWIPAGPSNGPRLGYGSDYGTDAAGGPLTAVGVTRMDGARGIVPGAWPSAGFDAGRGRVYPAALLPVPSAAPVEGPRASLRLYPNPLRGDRLTVRFTLDRPASVRLTAYDLAGQQVADLSAQGATGPDGNEIPWNLARLAPGLYQVRVRFLGEGWNEEMLEKVAVLR